MTIVHSYQKGRLLPTGGAPVVEFPLELTVNGRKLATLIASPAGRIPGVTGVILAGGESRRMGCAKALLPYRKVSDRYPGRGVLAGIQSGLHHSGFPRIFVTACDMLMANVTS